MSDPEDSNDKTEIRTADGRFAPGNRGGPGRPRGPVSASAIQLDELGIEAALAFMPVLRELGLAGNVKCIDMVLQRVWPAHRGRPVAIDAPEVITTADLLPAHRAITGAMLDGQVSPREGADAARMIAAHLNTLDADDFERRLQEVEAAGEKRKAEERKKAEERNR